MRVVTTPAELDEALERPHDPARLGLVPTMGSLHEGHLSLIHLAAQECRKVVVSVFVNPAQFQATSDLTAYPRDLESDAELASGAGADVVFAPDEATIYPEGFETWVEPTGSAQGMEGAARPGHFRGVATVCLKLFNMVAPSSVYFGWKDAQQTAVIGHMIDDLNLPLALRLGATVRDPDGLALSSRNARLSADERTRAALLPRALEAGVAAFRSGRSAVEAARALLASDTQIETDYVEEMSAHDHRLLCGAVRIGEIRLIDNMILEEPA